MSTLERMVNADDFDRKVYKQFGDKRTQVEYLKEYLDMYGSITPLEALSAFGCFRLSARIADLREEGYRISTEIHHDGRKSYAIYRWEEDDEVQSND